MKNQQSQDLTQGSIWRHLIAISFPAMVGLFFASLYNWVDTFWAGRLSSSALASMSVSFPLFLFSIAVAQCIAVGTMIMVSNSLGAKNIKDAKIYAEQGIGLSFLIGIVTMIVFWFAARPVLTILGATGAVLEQGVDYVIYLSFGVPFLSLTFTANSALNSRGNTKFMRNIFILNTAINIWLDPLLMYGIKIGGVTIIPSMEVRGLALATSLVQALGAFLIYSKLKREKYIRPISFEHYKIIKSRASDLVRYGFPSALQVGLVSVGLGVVNFFLFRLGNSFTVAGYGIGLRIEQMALIPSFGVSIALSALVGQNNGAQRFKRVQQTLKNSLTMAVVILVLVMVPLSVFSRYVAMLFSSNGDIIVATSTYLYYAVFAFYGYQLMFLSSSTLQGMKFPNVPIYAALVRQLVLPWLFIPLFSYVFGMGYQGVFLNIIFSAWLPALALTYFALRKIKDRIREQSPHADDTALLVVDVQNDFLPPDGVLKVLNGDSIIKGINNRAQYYSRVVGTKDYHPAGHKSFASSHNEEVGKLINLNGVPQILWPDHCVQNSKGAEFPKELHTEKFNHVVEKGTDKEVDSYSAFFDNEHKKQTSLHKTLTEWGVKKLHICGLATDYCVKHSVLDAIQLGYKVRFIKSLSRAINTNPSDEKKAIKAMRKAGVIVEV